jgi:hypothetical protein
MAKPMSHFETQLRQETRDYGLDEQDFNLLVVFHSLRTIVGYRALRGERGRKAYLNQLLESTKAKHIAKHNAPRGMFLISIIPLLEVRLGFIDLFIYVFMIVVFFLAYEHEMRNGTNFAKFRLMNLQHQLPKELIQYLNNPPALSNYTIESCSAPEGILVCEFIPTQPSFIPLSTHLQLRGVQPECCLWFDSSIFDEQNQNK